ncbi:MAG: hypothetical protein ACF8XB_05965, partial [Planctomycetota bacterium JB042]
MRPFARMMLEESRVFGVPLDLQGVLVMTSFDAIRKHLDQLEAESQLLLSEEREVYRGKIERLEDRKST